MKQKGFTPISMAVMVTAIFLTAGVGDWYFVHKNKMAQEQSEWAAKRTNPLAGNASFATDFTNNEKLVGASHNIFVGKVTRMREKIIDSGSGFSYFQFDVRVLLNIKGGLEGTVLVGQLDISRGNLISPVLRVDSTYVLATREHKEYNSHTVGEHVASVKLISADSKLSDSILINLAEKNSRVRELRIAYPDEILLRADISHNNTVNSFISLPQAKQDRLRAEAERLKEWWR